MNSVKTHISVLLYFLIGLVILSLNKLRYLKQYRNPRGFKASEIERAIQHDIRGVVEIEKDLSGYLSANNPFQGKTVLELGPGPDIGIGAMLLDRGAAGYCGFDKNHLMKVISDDFYVRLRNEITNEDAKRHLDLFKTRNAADLQYVVDPDFDLAKITKNKFNLVISRSAFEHFDDIDKTLGDLSALVQTGAVLHIVLDLMTHSRWIRQRDPNNIYRYPEWLYELLHYPGIPNRIRPEYYVELLNRCAWTSIQLKWTENHPLLASGEHTLRGLSKEFKAYDMRILTCAIMATKQ